MAKKAYKQKMLMDMNMDSDGDPTWTPDPKDSEETSVCDNGATYTFSTEIEVTCLTSEDIWTEQSTTMAVKKREMIQDPRMLDVASLAKNLQIMTEHTSYLSSEELFKQCENIVNCLARSQGSYAAMWEPLQIIENFLMFVINAVEDLVRHEIIVAILQKFNLYTSDPNANTSPATSVVLVVLNFCDNEGTQETARCLVQESEGPGSAGLRASLSCLYNWMSQMTASPSLDTWIMIFIKALEENERFDVLIEVTMEYLACLFSMMTEPPVLRQSSAEIIFHVLSSLRETKEALDVVTPLVEVVLNNLASDSTQFSRQVLQNIVDIVSEMVHGLSVVDNDAMSFRTKYWDVILCLERHMSSQGCAFLQLPAWNIDGSASALKKSESVPKVGLMNLGNTCYMNSVIQALLLTRQFSTYATLNMAEVPYWSLLGVLFAELTHSVATKLQPLEFFKTFKPPFFTVNTQHDSSEFLGYVFELLKAYEYSSEYSKAPVMNVEHNSMYRMGSPTPYSGVGEMENEDGSFSPRPGGSGIGPSSSLKRPSNDSNHNLPLKKRNRTNDLALKRVSLVDNLFSGVLLTRVKCIECKSSSLSRDEFRELQLAFPEKPEGFQYTVQNLLEYYCSEEILEGDNMYKCRECGVLREAERSVLVETTPKYLIIVLKNFKFDPKLQVQTKLMLKTYHNHIITLPTVCTAGVLSSYMLYAAIVHAGTTLDSGHYYTLGKDSCGWHTFNDDVVTDTSPGEVNRLRRCCTPYVLFYRRSDMDEGTAPTLDELPPKLQEHLMSHNKEIVDNALNQRRIDCCP